MLVGTTGFQSPADDYEQSRIDLAKELATTIASVLYIRVEGGSTRDDGINDDDIVVCDRAKTTTWCDNLSENLLIRCLPGAYSAPC